MARSGSTRSSKLRRYIPDEEHPDTPLVGALMRFGFAIAEQRLLDALAEAGFDDINRAHLKVLRFPAPDGERPSVLAQRANMTKQAMNYLLVQLEELGYLERPASSASARLVSLTERGWRVAALQRQTMYRLQREWSAKVGEERFAVFMGVMRECVLPARVD